MPVGNYGIGDNGWVVSDGILYVAGMQAWWNKPLSIYSIESNSWTTPLNENSQVYPILVELAGGSIIVVGDKGNADKYDPVDSVWNTVSLSAPINAFGITSQYPNYEHTTVGDEIYFFKDTNASETEVHVFSYNWKTDHWMVKPSIPVGTGSALRIKNVNGHIYLLNVVDLYEYFPN